ncbi:MAG TPA: hypothetical protein VL134_01050 [Leptolyngbya sp.]|nr:hypothetical protein [Leptolyngbya sp.]
MKLSNILAVIGQTQPTIAKFLSGSKLHSTRESREIILGSCDRVSLRLNDR